jgi:ketosteroid isomerase-like protein
MAKSNADLARTLTNLWNEGVRSVPTEYLDADVEVDSRVELDQPCGVVMTFTAEQRVRRVRIYWDVAAAREAVGVAD